MDYEILQQAVTNVSELISIKKRITTTGQLNI